MCTVSPKILWDGSLSTYFSINGAPTTRCVTLNQTSYTVAFWSNVTTPPAGIPQTLIAIEGGNDVLLTETHLIMSPDRLSVQFRFVSQPWCVVNETNATGMTGTYNSWHHHAFTYDAVSQNVTLYRDAAVIGSGAFFSMIGNACYAIDLTPGPTIPISSTEVFNRSLSIADLRLLFATGTYNSTGIMSEVMFQEQNTTSANQQTADTAYNDGHTWAPFDEPYPFNVNGWHWSGCANRTLQALQCQQTGCPPGKCVPTPGPAPMCSPFFVTGPCSSAPCVNGGTCVDGGTSWSCNCPPAFAGPTCQRINHCASFPCQNGGKIDRQKLEA